MCTHHTHLVDNYIFWLNLSYLKLFLFHQPRVLLKCKSLSGSMRKSLLKSRMPGAGVSPFHSCLLGSTVHAAFLRGCCFPGLCFPESEAPALIVSTKENTIDNCSFYSQSDLQVLKLICHSVCVRTSSSPGMWFWLRTSYKTQEGRRGRKPVPAASEFPSSSQIYDIEDQEVWGVYHEGDWERELKQMADKLAVFYAKLTG